MLPIPLRYSLAMATQFEPIVPAKLIIASLCASLVGLLVSTPGWGQQKGYGQTLGTTQREREFYNNNMVVVTPLKYPISWEVYSINWMVSLTGSTRLLLDQQSSRLSGNSRLGLLQKTRNLSLQNKFLLSLLA